MAERAKRKLTMGQMFEVGRLRRRWPSATDEERKKIEAQIREIEYGDKEEPPKKSQQNPEQKASGQANPSPKEKPDSSKEKPDNDEYAVAPDEGMPHMSYCACTEIMVMVDTANGWMSYDKFRETHHQTVFDINPDKITVMYLNHDRYREILETAEDVQLDQRNVVARCARLLPEDIKPIEVTILSGLLCIEAWYDPRISELGYEPGSMQECEERGLFEDFFNGVIYNMLHSELTREEARYFAEHGELPNKAVEGEQPSKPDSPEQTPSSKDGAKPKSEQQPKQQPKPHSSTTRRRRKFI